MGQITHTQKIGHSQVVYNILFRTAAETLRIIAADPKHLGAGIGLIAVLHSWGQTLSYHPHLHCIVPGGGPSGSSTCADSSCSLSMRADGRDIEVALKDSRWIMAR